MAQINREKYGLNVKVVTLGSIYKEFATGNPDIAAIRNFVKYVYDNASSPENKLKYLCLLETHHLITKEEFHQTHIIFQHGMLTVVLIFLTLYFR